MLAALTSRPWACAPRAGSAFLANLERVLAATPRAEQVAPQPRQLTVNPDGAAALSLRGVMLHKPPAWLGLFMDLTDTSQLAADVKALDAEPAVRRIVIHADSPGGMVGGVPELAAAIAATRKPVEVRVDGMLCSAAVWAVAHADKITATPSSEIGSIGVYTVEVDKTGALDRAGLKLTLVATGPLKGAGADGRVTAAMIEEDQRGVDQLRDMFVADLSAGRGRDLKGRATGQTWLAEDARRIGLIDAVEL